MANQSDLGKAFFKESASGSLKRPQTEGRSSALRQRVAQAPSDRGGSSSNAPNALPGSRALQHPRQGGSSPSGAA
ncbi:hypothetical protein LR48_Vigan11g163300 [Vigna angularis]|uniref:Uncharacterized protein n=1 Tax=Phaseolus angularis TaxID=3914 RepID=A0A0L9VUZ2_PHAAN|nr:hypothetical protein LR48_Vigan11g163300 [Vigna angularis]